MHRTPMVEMMNTSGTAVPAVPAMNGVLSDMPTIIAMTATESAMVSIRLSLRLNIVSPLFSGAMLAVPGPAILQDRVFLNSRAEGSVERASYRPRGAAEMPGKSRRHMRLIGKPGGEGDLRQSHAGARKQRSSPLQPFLQHITIGR